MKLPTNHFLCEVFIRLRGMKRSSEFADVVITLIVLCAYIKMINISSCRVLKFSKVRKIPKPKQTLHFIFHKMLDSN